MSMGFVILSVKVSSTKLFDACKVYNLQASKFARSQSLSLSSDRCSTSTVSAFPQIGCYYTNRKFVECIDAKSIILDPEYQRDVVWDEGRAALLVTSILSTLNHALHNYSLLTTFSGLFYSAYHFQRQKDYGEG
jgi:hypothetical protein